jgi:hypothetical protein
MNAQSEDPRWEEVKARIDRGDKAKEKSKNLYLSAGRLLNELKTDHDKAGGTWAEWATKCKEKAGISKSRASELMHIADGRKTAEDVRREGTQRKREHDERKKTSPLRNGEKPQPMPSPAQNQREMEAQQAHIDEPEAAHERDRDFAEQLQAAKIEIVGLEGEIADLKRENAELREQLEAARKVAPPADDGLDIPECLRRQPPPARADAVDDGAAQADQ